MAQNPCYRLAFGQNVNKEVCETINLCSYIPASGEWDEEVITDTRDYCESEAKRLGFPDGWRKLWVLRRI